MKIIQTLLLVGPSDHDEFLLRRVLRKAGIASSVVRLRNSREAIDYLGGTGLFAEWDERPAIDLMFLDMEMPKSPGFKVLEWLGGKSVQPAPLVVMMLSASTDQADYVRSQELGAHEFCTKPPTIELLRGLATRHGLRWPGGAPRSESEG